MSSCISDLSPETRDAAPPAACPAVRRVASVGRTQTGSGAFFRFSTSDVRRRAADMHMAADLPCFAVCALRATAEASAPSHNDVHPANPTHTTACNDERASEEEKTSPRVPYDDHAPGADCY